MDARKLLVTCLVCIATQIAYADTNPYRGSYFGVETGLALHHLDAGEINRLYQVEDPAATKVDDELFGYAVYGGYRLFKYLSVDGGFMDLGESAVHIGYYSGFDCSTGTCIPARRSPTTISLNDVRGPRFRANGYWPLNQRWSLDARLGLVLIASGDSGSFLPMGGVGVTYSLSQSLRARLFWDRLAPISIDSEAVDCFSLGLGYQF